MTGKEEATRRLVILALCIAMIALVLSGYAVMMAFDHRAEVRALGDVLHQFGKRETPVAAPPLELDPDPR